MLRVAKQKLPDTLFLKADMATFSIKQKFDVIYCVHNSLNHLYKIEDWDRMFQAVYEHLAPEGIFIFDINTPDRMDFLASFPTGLTPLEDVILATKVRKTSRPYLYLWDLKISNPERPESRSYHQSIKILAPPLAGTIDLVQERFTLLDYITLTQDTVEERNRVYCICRKAE
jgi:SAM-dependent methyltransferase